MRVETIPVSYPPPPQEEDSSPLPPDFLSRVGSTPQPPPLPEGKRYHVFLTHNWADDTLGRSNHARVSRVNAALKALGFITWFDEDRMTGLIRPTMAQALYDSAAVLCFITSNYETRLMAQTRATTASMNSTSLAMNNLSSIIASQWLWKSI